MVMHYFFYFFALSLILLSCSVIASKNPVNSVLFLILTFINSAVLFLLLDAEFIAMILIIVYAGAIAVFFLFIVIMLGIEAIKQQICDKKWYILLASIALFFEICSVYFMQDFTTQNEGKINIDTYLIGSVLYTDYFYPFQIAGVILLVAMIGAIILTLKHNRFVRKQSLIKQLSRTSDIKLVKS